MCKHGTVRMVDQDRLPGKDYREKTHRIELDECIADLVLSLNDGGMYTIGCCCGHGNPPGEIHLADGRMLLVIEKRMFVKSIDVITTKIEGIYCSNWDD